MFLHVLQIYCEFIVLMIYLLGKLKNKVFVGYAKFWNWNTRQFLYTVSNTCAKYFVVHCKNIKSFFSLSQVTIMHFKLLWFKKMCFTFTHIIKTSSTLCWFSCSLFFQMKGQYEEGKIRWKRNWNMSFCFHV